MRILFPLGMTASIAFAQGPASEPSLNTGIPDWVGAWMFLPLAVALLAFLFAFISTSETRSPHDKNDDAEDHGLPHTWRSR